MGPPSGIVTFLFTDIEGSTTHLQADQEGTPAVIKRHNELLRDAIEEHNGYVVKTEGDAFFATFHDARDALLATIAGQTALLPERWNDGSPLRVRMALHTGRARAEEGDYLALSVNRAARILPGAWGGQILLSAATHTQLLDDLHAEVDLLDLGLYRLKDLARDEHVYQVVAPGLETSFGPLAVRLPPAQPLPISRTPFIGRKEELEAASSRLAEEHIHLLTLTGPGGTGKTRLVLQLAADAVDRYPQGITILELDTLTDPALVMPALAAQIGVKEVAGQELVQSVAAHLHTGRRLLVIDNAEHLIDAVAEMVDLLLDGCPSLDVLVTSRRSLEVEGEYEYPVPPLRLPPRPPPSPPPELLSQCDAVKLFLEVATRARPDFAVTAENAPAIAELCWRLDGLPLAVELAAARIKHFGSPDAVLAQLSLDLVGGGRRRVPDRQKTLRSAIAWSYNLLTSEEQRVFRALSVFAGGCTLDAATTIAGPNAPDALMSLLDHSLLRLDVGGAGEPRYRMLETVREFAVDQGSTAGEADSVRAKHASYFVDSVRRMDRTLQVSNDLGALDLIVREQDNLRAALNYLLETAPRVAFDLVLFLSAYWYRCSLFQEGRLFLSAAISAAAGIEGRRKALALTELGKFEDLVGDARTSQRHYEEALNTYRWERATAGQATVLHQLGIQAHRQREYERAERHYLDSLELSRKMAGATQMQAATLHQLGNLAQDQDRYQSAHDYYAESLHLRHPSASGPDIALTVYQQGLLARRQGQYQEAASRYAECLAVFQNIGDRYNVALVLEDAGDLAVAMDEDKVAAVLWGAASRIREEVSAPVPLAWADWQARQHQMVQARLGMATWRDAWAHGCSLPVDLAVGYARDFLRN